MNCCKKSSDEQESLIDKSLFRRRRPNKACSGPTPDFQRTLNRTSGQKRTRARRMFCRFGFRLVGNALVPLGLPSQRLHNVLSLPKEPTADRREIVGSNPWGSGG